MESDGRCVGSVASFEQQKRPARPRVAVGLRGESFRNWGSRTTQGTCCHTATVAAQAAVAASHERLLFAPLERMGFEVDVFIATYRCTNGRDWVEKRLLSSDAYAGRLRGVYISEEENATQAGAFARTLELANNEALSRQDLDLGVERMVSNDRAYEHVFVLRLDEELVRADIDCLFGMDAPINWWSNFDEFAYFPGRYFECAVKHRHFLGVGDLEKIQRLAGDQVTYQLKQKQSEWTDSKGHVPTKCMMHGWQESKASAQRGGNESHEAMESQGQLQRAREIEHACRIPRVTCHRDGRKGEVSCEMKNTNEKASEQRRRQLEASSNEGTTTTNLRATKPNTEKFNDR